MNSYKTSNSLNKTSGFTIVELLVVIVVIGILAAVSIVAYIGVSQKAAVASIQSDLTSSASKLKLYYTDNGAYPASLDGSNCPVGPADTRYCLKLSSSNSVDYYGSNSTSFRLIVKNTANTSLKYQVTNIGSPATATSWTSYYDTVMNTSGLVSYWRLGEAVGDYADSGPNGYTLTYNNATRGTNGAILGDANAALTTIVGNISASKTSGVTLSAPYTVEFWSKTVGTAAGSTMIELGGYYPIFSPDWYNTKPLLYLNGSNYMYGNIPANDGAWHYLVFVVTGTGISDILTAKIYVDGVASVWFTSSATAPVSPDGHVYIGANSATPNTCSFDELALYNVALTPAQVTAHYSAGTQ